MIFIVPVSESEVLTKEKGYPRVSNLRIKKNRLTISRCLFMYPLMYFLVVWWRIRQDIIPHAIENAVEPWVET